MYSEYFVFTELKSYGHFATWEASAVVFSFEVTFVKPNKAEHEQWSVHDR